MRTGSVDPVEFRIRALAASDADPLLINERDVALANGQEVSSSIPRGTFAVFPFQVDSAGAVIVSVGETGVDLLAEPRLQVFDPNGDLVDQNSGNSDAVVQFATLQTGTFTAVVADNQNDEPLEFRIVATGISNSLPPLLGDVNQDGFVNFLDISPFIAILSVSGGQAEADINEDAEVNFLDISPFIAILSSQ